MASRKTIIRITQAEYERLNDDYGGACLECGEIAEGGVEPDAEGYECEGCGALAVCGIEQALMLGRLTLIPEPREKY